MYYSQSTVNISTVNGPMRCGCHSLEIATTRFHNVAVLCSALENSFDQTFSFDVDVDGPEAILLGRVVVCAYILYVYAQSQTGSFG